jgi:hypothetical protein
MHSIAAPLSGVEGVVETTNCVLLVILLITVLDANAPVPDVTRTGIPARSNAVELTVTVVPLLLTFVKVGLMRPTRNLANTHAASQFEGPDSLRHEFSHEILKRTITKFEALFAPADRSRPRTFTFDT